jgi:site-specific DNA recombinase
MSKKAGTYYYYMCYSRDGNKEMKKIDFCKNPNYREDVLDDIVKREILELALNPAKIDEMSKRNQAAPDDRLTVLHNRMAETNKQINKLMDLYQLGTIPLSDISARVEPLHKERKQLENEINELTIKKLPTLSVDASKKIIGNAENIFSNGSLDEQRNLINMLIRKIIILNDGADIYWKFI